MVVKTVVYLGHLGEQYISLAPKLWHSKTLFKFFLLYFKKKNVKVAINTKRQVKEKNNETKRLK